MVRVMTCDPAKESTPLPPMSERRANKSDNRRPSGALWESEGRERARWLHVHTPSTCHAHTHTHAARSFNGE